MQKFSTSFDPFALLEPFSGSVRWCYGVYEFENFLHRKLNRTRYDAKLRVGYPGAFPLPAFEMHYRAKLPAGTFLIRTNGEAQLFGADWTPVGENLYSLSCTESAWIQIRIQVGANDTPALWTDAPASVTWEVPWCGGWSNADVVLGSSSIVPPHRMPPVMADVPLERKGNVWDAGHDILADVSIQSSVEPVLRVGESLAEAMNDDPAYFEQSVAVERVGEGLWKSAVPLAFQFVRIANALPQTQVSVRAYVTPVVYHGTFVSVDEDLNAIWNTAAYTLHTSMQDFILDGIKRDRMPWGGDIWVGLLADCATFFDATIAQRSLSVFLAAGGTAGDVNTIIDYTLLLVISFDEYCRHFGDRVFLVQRWRELKAMIEKLFTRCDEKGFLTEEITRIFIDWMDLKHESVVQMLWLWALESVAHLARRMGDEALAERAETHREKLLVEVETRYFDAASGLYRTTAADAAPDQIYPQALAILAGVAKAERTKALCDAMKSGKYGEPGTPYSAQFILMALEKAGDVEGAFALIRRWWLPMVKIGANTFFEAGKEQSREDASDYSFYGRAFGKSLCHAWASGVTYVIPKLLTGIEPVEDGFRMFKVSAPTVPWDYECKVPTPYGAIRIAQENGKYSVEAPSKCERI